MFDDGRRRKRRRRCPSAGGSRAVALSGPSRGKGDVAAVEGPDPFGNDGLTPGRDGDDDAAAVAPVELAGLERAGGKRVGGRRWRRRARRGGLVAAALAAWLAKKRLSWYDYPSQEVANALFASIEGGRGGYDDARKVERMTPHR